MFNWLGEDPCADEVLKTYKAKGFRIDASRVSAWKQELSEEDLREFERIAGDLIDILGYREA